MQCENTEKCVLMAGAGNCPSGRPALLIYSKLSIPQT
nr:MAG TPA: hypothetical protein [Caudoviricetes sp.]